jgi:hypothetical protein
MNAPQPTTGLLAMPEWVNRRDLDNGPWAVQEGRPVRGDAWTNRHERLMRVPGGADATSRVIRAHEMMHAKVSPAHWGIAEHYKVTVDALRAAEEYRVNTLTRVAGFDLDALCDGSEVRAGQRCGENADWDAMVMDVAAMAGTKACKDYLRGLRSTNPDLAVRAKAVEKAVVTQWRNRLKGYRRSTPAAAKERSAARDVGATRAVETVEVADFGPVVVNQGFAAFTVPLARLLDSLRRPAEAQVDPDDDGLLDVEDINQAANGGARGAFARLLFDDLPLTRRVPGSLGRKRVATNVGRHPRRINRMLTDPQRRVFDKVTRGQGGIVVIDQSGSMRFSQEDLWAIVEAAPGCLVVGYSHRQGSTETPNAWVYADRGKVVDKVRDGNGGNGVDGPVLRWAIGQRRHNEAIVWVCDGCVTDGQGDSVFTNLTIDCARLVKRHGIHMVGTADEAVTALRRAANGRLPMRAIGAVGREMPDLA